MVLAMETMEIRMPDSVFQTISSGFLKPPIRKRFCSHDAVVITFDDQDAACDAFVLAKNTASPGAKVYYV